MRCASYLLIDEDLTYWCVVCEGVRTQGLWLPCERWFCKCMLFPYFVHVRITRVFTQLCGASMLKHDSCLHHTKPSMKVTQRMLHCWQHACLALLRLHGPARRSQDVIENWMPRSEIVAVASSDAAGGPCRCLVVDRYSHGMLTRVRQLYTTSEK